MSLLRLHLSLMSLACLLMLAAICVARCLKSKRWWMKAHKALIYAALASLAGGLAAAAVMVGAGGPSPESLPHRIAGGLAIGLGFATALLGLSIFKGKGKEAIASRKGLHRWAGRVEALLMLGAIGLGLRLIGLI